MQWKIMDLGSTLSGMLKVMRSRQAQQQTLIEATTEMSASICDVVRAMSVVAIAYL